MRILNTLPVRAKALLLPEVLKLLPLQGALLNAFIPRAVPWAKSFCPFRACCLLKTLPSVGDRWFRACGANMRNFNNQKVLLHHCEAGLFGYNIFIATHPNGCGTMSRESFADSWQCMSMEHATPPEDSVRTDAYICWAQSRNASGRHEPATG